MKPFLKWAGGKRMLYDKLKPYIPQYNTYFEPFIGGAAVLLLERPERAIISDNNGKLVNCYQQIKGQPEEVIEVLTGLNNSYLGKESFYNNRDKFNSLTDYNTPLSAGLLIWLNKYCYNGLYRESKNGTFNAPFGYKKNIVDFDFENIRSISNYLQNNNIQVLNSDFELTCLTATEGDFVYFDPPYAPISKTASFAEYNKEGFSYQNHVRLLNLLDKLTSKGVKCMLNNSVCDFTKELYKNYKQIVMENVRSINCDKDNRKGYDLLVLNY